MGIYSGKIQFSKIKREGIKMLESRSDIEFEVLISDDEDEMHDTSTHNLIDDSDDDDSEEKVVTPPPSKKKKVTRKVNVKSSA